MSEKRRHHINVVVQKLPSTSNFRLHIERQPEIFKVVGTWGKVRETANTLVKSYYDKHGFPGDWEPIANLKFDNSAKLDKLEVEFDALNESIYALATELRVSLDKLNSEPDPTAPPISYTLTVDQYTAVVRNLIERLIKLTNGDRWYDRKLKSLLDGKKRDRELAYEIGYMDGVEGVKRNLE